MTISSRLTTKIVNAPLLPILSPIVIALNAILNMINAKYAIKMNVYHVSTISRILMKYAPVLFLSMSTKNNAITVMINFSFV